MKIIFVKSFTARQNWHEIAIKLKQIFTGITGYDVMFQASRKDLPPIAPSFRADSLKRIPTLGIGYACDLLSK